MKSLACLPLFAQLAEQIGGVHGVPRGLPNHCGAVKSSFYPIVFTANGECGNPSGSSTHLPY